MKKIVLRYGILAGLAEVICFALIWLFIYITNVGHEVQGYIGYINIICPLLFVYFGIRYYRDGFNNGTISFLKALKIWLLIVIIPALSFALVETIYVLYLDPKFYETIMNYDIEQYRKVLSPAEFAAKLKEVKQALALDKNPLFNFSMMFFTIAATGILISLVSALMLMRSVKKEAVSN